MLRSQWNVRSFLMTLTAVLIAAGPAHAQAAVPGQASWMQFVPLVFMFVVMYFLIIRPQGKKAQTHKEFLTKLSRGDEVLTASGILGRVEGLTDTFVTLEISPGVRIKVVRTQIASYLPKAGEVAEVKA